LKRNTSDPGPDAPIHSASPSSPLNLKDTLEITREHLPEDTVMLLAPPSKYPDFGEEKTKRLVSGRMFQPETPSPLCSSRLQGS